MAKIEPTTVAIAAAAAYFLLRPKDAKAEEPDDGGCADGFVPGPGGLCVPAPGDPDPGITFESDPGIPDDNTGSDATPFDSNIDPGYAPGPESDPMGPGGFAQLPGDPAQPLPPAPADVDMSQLTSSDPFPGRFYQVKQGDYFNKVSKEAIYNAALTQLEMMAPLMPQAEKNAIASSIKSDGWGTYRELIQCSPFNDMLYGTYGVGASPFKGMNGRGFRFLRKHADNYTRIDQGDEPIRNIQWGTPNGPKAQGVNAGPGFNRYELLWMPGISYPALINPNFTFGAVELAQWPAWEWSQIVPPRAVWDRGFTDLAGDNDPNVYGCDEYEQAGG